MKNRTKGVYRLALSLSLLWLIGSAVFLANNNYHSYMEIGRTGSHHCETIKEEAVVTGTMAHDSNSDIRKNCFRDLDLNLSSLRQFFLRKWITELVGYSLIPALFFLLAAYALWAIGRWVYLGFTENGKPSS